jgi:hypothetical protein
LTQNADKSDVLDTITSTKGHKYYLPFNSECREIGEKHEHAGYEGLSNKWVSACNLKKGDKVLLSNGEYGIIKGVKVRELETPETTYNFEVLDYHTYHVGKQSVCVHNKCWEWGKGSFDSVDDSLVHHAGKHGSDLGLKPTDTAGYFKKATNFADTIVQRGVKAGRFIDGATPGIYQYSYMGKYIHMDKFNKIIVSFGMI